MLFLCVNSFYRRIEIRQTVSFFKSYSIKYRFGEQSMRLFVGEVTKYSLVGTFLSYNFWQIYFVFLILFDSLHLVRISCVVQKSRNKSDLW